MPAMSLWWSLVMGEPEWQFANTAREIQKLTHPGEVEELTISTTYPKHKFWLPMRLANLCWLKQEKHWNYERQACKLGRCNSWNCEWLTSWLTVVTAREDAIAFKRVTNAGLMKSKALQPHKYYQRADSILKHHAPMPHSIKSLWHFFNIASYTFPNNSVTLFMKWHYQHGLYFLSDISMTFFIKFPARCTALNKAESEGQNCATKQNLAPDKNIIAIQLLEQE